MADGGNEEALVWDTGLSTFLGRLEEDLIRWHSEERVKAKEREVKCMRAQKDVMAVEASIREGAAAQLIKGAEDDPFEETADTMLRRGKDQREDMRQLLDLIRGHVKANMPEAGSAILAKLPTEGQPVGLASDEFPKLIQAFFDAVADTPPASAGATASRKSGKEDRPRKEKRGRATEKKSKKASKADRGVKERRDARQAELDDDYYSYCSSSRSPSVDPRARPGAGAARATRPKDRKRRRRERYTRSCSFSDYDSRSWSVSSREYRRPRGGDRRGGGPGARPPPRGDRDRGGGGGGGREDGRSVDFPAEVDRFLRVNKLEAGGRVDKVLRELDVHMARKVMGLTGGGPNTFELSGDVRDPTAVVMARVRKAREDPRNAGGDPRGGGGGGGRPGGPPRRPAGGGGGGDRRRRREDSRSFSRSPPRRRGGGPEPPMNPNAMPLGKARDFPVKLP